MTDATANNLQRLHDLLSEQATAGLSDPDQLELQQLLVDNATLQREGYELAAAAVDLALVPPGGMPLPERVRRNALMKSTMEAEPESEIEPVVYKLAEEKSIAPRRVTSVATAASSFDESPIEPNLPPESSGKMGGRVALAIIGVACLTIYAAGRSGNAKKETKEPAPAPMVAPAKGSAASSCDIFKTNDPNLMTLSWSASDPTLGDVSGDVRFSVKLQQGCMSLTGLPKLEPAQAVYQLWIIDSDRQGPPVDAGLFEATGSVTKADQIAFTPKLSVSNPVVFAITREPPGGVVTSKNQPIVVAKVGK